MTPEQQKLVDQQIRLIYAWEDDPFKGMELTAAWTILIDLLLEVGDETSATRATYALHWYPISFTTYRSCQARYDALHLPYRAFQP